jgi:hypothetical protein
MEIGARPKADNEHRRLPFVGDDEMRHEILQAQPEMNEFHVTTPAWVLDAIHLIETESADGIESA